MSFPRYQVQFCETASQIADDFWDACFLPPAEAPLVGKITLDPDGV
jgi:hypothetical protein